MVVSDNLFIHALKVTTNHGSYDTSKELNEVLRRFILVYYTILYQYRTHHRMVSPSHRWLHTNRQIGMLMEMFIPDALSWGRQIGSSYSTVVGI